MHVPRGNWPDRDGVVDITHFLRAVHVFVPRYRNSALTSQLMGQTLLDLLSLVKDHPSDRIVSRLLSEDRSLPQLVSLVHHVQEVLTRPGLFTRPHCIIWEIIIY